MDFPSHKAERIPALIITNDESMAKRAKYLTTQAKEEGIEYIHNEVGHNYRLANVLAAIGVAQLEALENSEAEHELSEHPFFIFHLVFPISKIMDT